MAKPTLAPKTQVNDDRLYCDYGRLVRLQAQAEAFSLLPHIRAGSVLSGRHNSLFRGRGLNFEELRHYQLGDDIRNLDWKVTMRTGKPHVRSYTEEKDRNVIICVDQRSSMFFASDSTMKSVVAAEIASMCAWRILKDGDRVGFIIAGQRQLSFSKPQRSQNLLLAQLRRLASENQKLNVSSQDADEVGFDKWFGLIKRMKLKQATLVFISDWHDCAQHHLDQLKQLQQHNDVMAVMVSDPFEHTLPAEIANSNWVVGDGTYQMNLDSAQKLSVASDGLAQKQDSKRQSLAKLMSMKGLPTIELSTDGSHIGKFQRQVGGR